MAIITKHVNATSSGETSLIAAVANRRIIAVKGSVHNGDSATVEVGIRAGTGGTDFWHAVIGADGGGSLFDFSGADEEGQELAQNTALLVNLSNGSTYNVDINLTYEMGN